MHRAGLDRFLQVPNPILEFTTRHWERGTVREEFDQDLGRKDLVLYARVVKNAVTTTARAIRTIMRAGD